MIQTMQRRRFMKTLAVAPAAPALLAQAPAQPSAPLQQPAPAPPPAAGARGGAPPRLGAADPEAPRAGGQQLDVVSPDNGRRARSPLLHPGAIRSPAQD